MKSTKLRKGLFFIVIAIILFFSRFTMGFSKVIYIKNNEKRSLDYYPNSNRRVYAFHDYGSKIPGDNAKFYGQVKGYDVNEVHIRYQNAIGGSGYIHSHSRKTNGETAQVNVNPNYDFFKTGSYIESKGSGNIYQIKIK